jgi:hypothetical protein
MLPKRASQRRTYAREEILTTGLPRKMECGYKDGTEHTRGASLVYFI